MHERLQTNERRVRQTSPPLWPDELILNSGYCDKAIEFIKDAKSEIRITAYAWRWYVNEPDTAIQKFNTELVKAMQRGVKITCIVNNSRMAVFFRGLGFNCKYVERNRMMHAKAISIDRRTLIVGSHNFTKRAVSDNYELSIATQDYGVIEQFITYFDTMWQSLYES